MTAAERAGAPRQLGMPLPFEEAEYARRLDAARAALAEAGLDAIILFGQESLHYLFGYDQLGYWIYQPVVLTAAASEVTVLARPLDHDLIEGLPFVRELRAWRDDSAAHDDPSGLTREMLADLGLLGAGRRIGIELRTHALLPYYYEKLRAALDGRCELVDASDLITELRLRKSDAEVAYAREAGRIMDAGFAAGFAAMRPGATEADVLADSLSAMLKAGGEMPALAPPLGAGARTLGKTHGAATQRVLREDEPFLLEIGGCKARYHAVGVQTKWLGTPPPRIQATYDVLVEALELGLEVVAPGVPVTDVARRVKAELARHDIPVAGRHVGYGTGIGFPPTWLDNLRIKETDPHVLECNFVFFLFAHHTVAHAGERLELFAGAPILVTATGNERLSRTALRLELEG
jgi:Xaa-Pro dipeptidase